MYIYFRMAKRRGCKRNTEINCCVFFRSSLYFPIFPKLSKRKFSYQLINYKFFYRKHGISFKFQFTGWPLCYHLSCNLWPLRHTPLAGLSDSVGTSISNSPACSVGTSAGSAGFFYFFGTSADSVDPPTISPE